MILELNAFPKIPTTKVIKNLTFWVFYFMPFKHWRAYGLAEPRDVKHFSKSKRSCASVDMRWSELRNYGYSPRYQGKVNQISLVSVSNLDEEL